MKLAHTSKQQVSAGWLSANFDSLLSKSFDTYPWFPDRLSGQLPSNLPFAWAYCSSPPLISPEQSSPLVCLLNHPVVSVILLLCLKVNYYYLQIKIFLRAVSFSSLLSPVVMNMAFSIWWLYYPSKLLLFVLLSWALFVSALLAYSRVICCHMDYGLHVECFWQEIWKIFWKTLFGKSGFDTILQCLRKSLHNKHCWGSGKKSTSSAIMLISIKHISILHLFADTCQALTF